MRINEIILRLFFPPKCIVCGELLDYFSSYPYCDACYAKMTLSRNLLKSPSPPPGIDELYIMYAYSYECVKHSVFHLKKMFSKQFADFFLDSCKRLFEKHSFLSAIDLVTYVTRRNSEKRREGIDQSEEMARVISSFTKIPYDKTLIRIRKSKKQRLLSTVERAENVRGLFKACRDVNNRSVLLVDDVMTTGSTISECAQALKKAGAKRVVVIVFSA